MSVTRFARIAVMASMMAGLVAARTPAASGTEVIVASGTMEGWPLHRSLFHIGEFWMRVTTDTEFNRWLSQGLDHNVVIMVVSDTRRFEDARNVRILSGTLIQNISGAITPIKEDVVGRLPEGDMGFVHELFVKDELTGSIGAVTFETADRVTASKFENYEGRHINIIIQIE